MLFRIENSFQQNLQTLHQQQEDMARNRPFPTDWLEGPYESLRDLKNFLWKLNDDKAVSHSMLVRQALDLSHPVSSYRTHKGKYEEKEIVSLLIKSKMVRSYPET